ncbi:hypothetical protein [Embleya sp. AB8]|uniref:hypothetical protein n=1 Tax=Embleya sp. AB8 TaxID=3156304 RepID=UPI003C784497
MALRKSLQATLGAVTLMASMALSVPTAQAATSSARPDNAHPNCSMNVTTGHRHCFATFREAISAATGGRVTDAPSTAKAGLADEHLTKELNDPTSGTITPAAKTNVVIGITYWDSNFAGPSYVYTAGNQCTDSTGDIDFQVNIQNDWQNRISSFVGFGNCYLKLWENTYWWGSSYGFSGSAGYLGAMDDRAKSIQWT